MWRNYRRQKDYDEGATNGRLLVLHLHPWLIGQPFRIGCLDEALSHIVHRQGVWAATGAEIIDELKVCRRSERENRVIDHDQEGSMELKKTEGYF